MQKRGSSLIEYGTGDSHVRLSWLAYTKIQEICRKSKDKEAGCFGTVEWTSDGVAYVHNVFVPDQEVSWASVDITGLGALVLELCGKGQTEAAKKLDFWMHCHPGDSVSPSGTDETTYKELKANFAPGSGRSLIMAIFSKDASIAYMRTELGGRQVRMGWQVMDSNFIPDFDDKVKSRGYGSSTPAFQAGYSAYAAGYGAAKETRPLLVSASKKEEKPKEIENFEEWLGVRIDPDLTIRMVKANSRADKHKICAGEQLDKIGGQLVFNYTAIISHLSNTDFKIGEKLTLVTKRGTNRFFTYQIPVEAHHPTDSEFDFDTASKEEVMLLPSTKTLPSGYESAVEWAESDMLHGFLIVKYEGKYYRDDEDLVGTMDLKRETLVKDPPSIAAPITLTNEGKEPKKEETTKLPELVEKNFPNVSILPSGWEGDITRTIVKDGDGFLFSKNGSVYFCPKSRMQDFFSKRREFFHLMALKDKMDEENKKTVTAFVAETTGTGPVADSKKVESTSEDFSYGL